MAVNTIFTVVFALLSQIGIVLENPPTDLASLINPEKTLTALQHKTDDASLIALIQTGKEVTATPQDAKIAKAIQDLGDNSAKVRREARKLLEDAGVAAKPHLESIRNHDDPEVSTTARELLKKIEQEKQQVARKFDDTYLARFMAIRLLGSKKCTAALPALKALAADPDPTIVAEAACARSMIESGKKAARPTGKTALTDICKQLPSDAGFVLMLDFEKANISRTAMETITKITQDPSVKKAMAGFNPALFAPQIDSGIQTALSAVGNIRVDAATMIFSSDIGDNSGYITWIFKGLYNPDKIMALCAPQVERGRMEIVKYKGYSILHDPHDPAIVLKDKNTLIISVGPGRGPDQIYPILDTLTTKKESTPSDTIAPALKIVQQANNRFAAAGALSDTQKADLRQNCQRELTRIKERDQAQLRDHHLLQKSICQIGIAICEMDRYIGAISTKGDISITCYTKKAAALDTVSKQVVNFEKQYKQLMKKSFDKIKEMGNQMPMPLPEIDFDKNYIEIKQLAGELTLSISAADMLKVFNPSMLFLGARVDHMELQQMDARAAQMEADF